METDDLTPAMQEMMAQLAQVRAELNELKGRAGTLTPSGPFQPEKPYTITRTRRNTLKRLGLALLGGVATAGALGEVSSVEAKVFANPQGALANKAGMLVVPPGAAVPTGTAPNYTYGLIASGNNSAVNLGGLPSPGAGLVGLNGFYGVYGVGTDTGVYGESTNNGVNGISSSGTGVVGGSTTGFGVNGYSSSSNGVYGFSSSDTGVYGASTDGTGVVGISDSGTGVYGYGASNGGQFEGGYVGAIGSSSNGHVTSPPKAGTSIGLVGNTGSALNLSVLNDNTYIGVYGRAQGGPINYAGFFQGNVNITGTISKGGGSFKIDHPQDPQNKYLYHSFVESPDMKNIYDGVVTLDEQGEATVTMPDWFEALNSDFRYQLTSMDQYAPVFVAERIANRRFKIAGGQGGQEVSWMLTGIRQDAWAKANRIPVEEEKSEDVKGKYLHPEVFGKSDEFWSM